VAFREPVCTGRIIPPEIKIECRDMCDSIQVSHQECTPGQARVAVDAGGAAAAGQRVSRVAQALVARMPELDVIAQRLHALKESGEIMVRTAGGFATALGSSGTTALLCSAQAVAELPRAVGQVSVAFQVSVSLSASVDVSSD
jgi:hypothetical protein